MRAAALALALAASCTACQRCSGKSATADAGAGESLGVAFAAELALPRFEALASTHDFGIPAGCRFDGPVRRAALPGGRLRFVAPRESLSSLAMAVGTTKDVERAGLIELETQRVEPVPWALLDAPPLLDKSSAGWFGAWSLPGEPGHARALGWRGGERAQVVLEGDQLEVADVACKDATCGVLGSLARAASAPGATLALGQPESGSWARVDLDAGGGEPWRPLALVRLEPAGTSWAALASDTHTALFSLRGARAEKAHVLDTPHRAYDAVMLDEPLVVAPGAEIDRPCGAEEFPIDLVTAQGARHTLRTPAPPESVVTRALSSGALVAWVAPVSCQHLDRRVVYLTLISKHGEPASSPMAVGDATGFALAAAGEHASLWLYGERGLSWIRLSCAPRDGG